MHQFSANSAGASARAALWSWHAGDGVLIIRADPGNPLASLDGRWTLQALLEQFDGLARMRIATPLKSGRPGDPVDIRVTLLNGAPAQFFGAFHDLGVARGLAGRVVPDAGRDDAHPPGGNGGGLGKHSTIPGSLTALPRGQGWPHIERRASHSQTGPFQRKLLLWEAAHT